MGHLQISIVGVQRPKGVTSIGKTTIRIDGALETQERVGPSVSGELPNITRTGS